MVLLFSDYAVASSETNGAPPDHQQKNKTLKMDIRKGTLLQSLNLELKSSIKPMGHRIGRNRH